MGASSLVLCPASSHGGGIIDGGDVQIPVVNIYAVIPHCFQQAVVERERAARAVEMRGIHIWR